jgi:hypothetical protein
MKTNETIEWVHHGGPMDETHWMKTQTELPRLHHKTGNMKVQYSKE